MTPREEQGAQCVVAFMRAAEAGELTPEDEAIARRFREAMESLREDVT